MARINTGTANRGARSQMSGGASARRDGTNRQSGRRNGENMSEQQLVGFLGRKIVQSMNDEDGDLSQVRQENFNAYVGKPYGIEREGYSSFQTREVLETVEWVLPSVLRVFLSGDDVVSFDPVGPEDEKQAQQETNLTNYFIMKSNNNGYGGFLPLHHWVKDCLMYPNGYVKCYMEEYEHTDTGMVTGLNEMGVQMIVQNPENEILEQRSRIDYIETPEGTQPAEFYDLKVRNTTTRKRLRVAAMPPEECLIDNDLTSTNLDEADFVCHRLQKNYSQLVREGLDPDELDNVGQGEDNQWNDERVNRMFYEDEDPDAEDEDDASMRQFWVHECYVWVDYDGDGIAEHRRVLLIGDKVFENEEINYQPVVAMSAILMAHKHNGMGFIEIMKELQLLSTVLTRQLLDNVYKQNVGKKFISEDALTEDGATMEALLNTQAEYVPVRGLAGNAAVPDVSQSIVGELLPVIEHAKGQVAMRTGVAPENTVDHNALQEVRQDVFTNALDRASQRVEMLVRIMAETGWRQLMSKAHQLLRSHWDIPKTVKLRGEWVPVDPQGWRDRTDMTVNVGLGFHTKQMQIQMLMEMLNVQKEAAGEGLATADNIYNTLDRLVTATNLGDTRMYFVDPESEEYQPPQPAPDPNMILAEAQAQALAREADRKDAELQLKAQGEQAKNQADVAKFQTDVQQAQIDAQIKQTDQRIKMEELAIKRAELQKMGVEVENIQADTQVKYATADKTMAEAVATAIEGSETYNEATKIVAQGGEQADYEGVDNGDEG